MAGTWIKFISFCQILAAVDLCLFIRLLTTIGNRSPCFSHVGEIEPELSTSSQGHGWLIYATEQLLERRPDTLVVGGVFRLSGVRVARGEQTPWGIQCHLLFVCPCRNVPSPSDGRRKAALNLCMKFYAFWIWQLWQRDCMNVAKCDLVYILLQGYCWN